MGFTNYLQEAYNNDWMALNEELRKIENNIKRVEITTRLITVQIKDKFKLHLESSEMEMSGPIKARGRGNILVESKTTNFTLDGNNFKSFKVFGKSVLVELTDNSEIYFIA